MKKLQSLVKVAALSVATVFALTQPAKAIIYSWEFTNEDGQQGSVTDKISGTVEFANPVFNGSASAIDVRVTEVTSAIDLSFLSDSSEVELNQNVLLTNPSSESNTFNFGSSGEITSASFAQFGDQTLSLGGFSGSSLLNQSAGFTDTFADSDSSSLTFSQASVPFEFSPTLGLFLMGGMFGMARYAKSRKANKLIDN